jgi:DNA polymerase III subunit gamma/tau
MDSLYQGGADPLMVLQDLLELSHFVTRLKLAPEAGAGDPLEEGDRDRARPLAAALSMPVLARVWQMLLKGLEEVQTAPAPAQAAAMVLVRLAYVADLPVPADLVRTLTSSESLRAPAALGPAPAVDRSAGVSPAPAASPAIGGRDSRGPSLAAALPAVQAPAPLPASDAPPSAELDPVPQSFAEVVALFDKHREALISTHLKEHVHLVAFEPGRIEFRPAAGAPDNLANRLSELLIEWTGVRWLIARSRVEDAGAPTLAQEEARRAGALRHEVAAHPLVQAVLETFPGATIAAVRERFVAADTATEAAADDVGDDVGDAQSDDGTSAGEDES